MRAPSPTTRALIVYGGGGALALVLGGAQLLWFLIACVAAAFGVLI